MRFSYEAQAEMKKTNTRNSVQEAQVPITVTQRRSGLMSRII